MSEQFKNFLSILFIQLKSFNFDIINDEKQILNSITHLKEMKKSINNYIKSVHGKKYFFERVLIRGCIEIINEHISDLNYNYYFETNM